jgi:hypothetical protein
MDQAQLEQRFEDILADLLSVHSAEFSPEQLALDARYLHCHYLLE